MEALPSHAEYFGHVRTIVGLVLGLSLARLVNGMTRFVQHPGTIKIYPVHLGWVIFLFITIVHFWWYEFHLSLVPVWAFPLYAFLIFYTMVVAALTALLFPDQMTDYKGFEDYFEQRKTLVLWARSFRLPSRCRGYTHQGKRLPAITWP